ncbi:MAG: lipopolysaccharide biosynthesis protein [Ruminococcus sp.]
MDNKDLTNTNLNIILKNDDDNENELVIPFKEILRCLRRFFLGWMAAAVLSVLLVAAWTASSSHQLSSPPVALIGFNYPGAEKGLTPNGDKLDVNSIKNPVVIENALTQLGYQLSNIDSIRNAITIEGIIPTDAADAISIYKQALDTNGNLQAAQSMLNVEYFPVNYMVTFDFSKTSFGDDDAAQVINMILECYRDYFFEQYGYNDSIGNASLAIDYSDYDYLVAVDTYSDTLATLRNKIRGLSGTQFRSTKTGYSFSDLVSEIDTVNSYNADSLTAYILSNSVVNDKNSMISYYEYRIEELERHKKAAQENLKTITNSISSYEKDSIIINGNSDESDALSYTTVSEKYDSLFQQKQEAQKNVSYYTMKISECQSRLDSVEKLKGGSADQKNIEYVENKLALLDEAIKELVDKVNDTLMEYNESITFANAYSVLVPANVLSTSYISMLVKNIMKPLLILEAVVFMIYIIVCVAYAFKTENAKKLAAEKQEQAPDTHSEQ